MESGVVVVFAVTTVNFADIASSESCDCSVNRFLRLRKLSRLAEQTKKVKA